jgi:anti-anti-sigma regulatory factor
MPREELRTDDDAWPVGGAPFTVLIRPHGEVLELAVHGPLDAWTTAALAGDLAAAYEPCYTEVLLDIAGVTAVDRDAVVGLARCRELAASKGLRFRITDASPVLHGVLVAGATRVVGGEGQPA